MSVILPRKLQQKVRSVFNTYPPSAYPRPLLEYEKSLLHFGYMNLFTLLVGLFFLVVLIRDPTSDDWRGVVFGYFMLQFVPLMLLEISSFKHFKLMRKADSRTVRTAELRPRRLSEFISPALIGVALIVYLGFVAFMLYINQFEYSWFGGYTNIVVITVMNLGF